MNTKWLNGLNIFYDDSSNESLRGVLKTDVSGHLVGTYQGPKASGYTTLYGRLETKNGTLRPSYLLPAFTQRTQKDVDTTPIQGSDDFVAVWASNDPGAFRIFARKYSVSERQGIGAPFTETLISGSNGDYVCPRVIYNPANCQLFACWIGVTERQLQGIWLDKDTLEPTSYPVMITSAVYPTLFNPGADLDTSTYENIVLMNHGDGVIVGVQETLSKINFLRVGSPSSGKSPVNLITSYSQTGMGKFHATFDTVHNNIMLVYIGTSAYVYGDRVRVFGKADQSEAEQYQSDQELQALSPVRLNNNVYASSQPYISAMPDACGVIDFLVTWSTGYTGIFFNRFDDAFIPLAAETSINPNDSGNTFPKAVASDNQIAVLLQATRFNGNALGAQGILAYVSNYD
ncbi:hypothetical protein [Pseudomonas chlororaphis]|uniref:hypothetical protein n=1 Tax=Pseudomonas chlororaphis TaxID=587753 RepID=UPI0006A5EA50|nr:hypothetical protein [Pseudomonas chlororaphis]AZD03518.1 hypothetical protein C4K27_4333 [Pseudomonas chlororaphis subsp. chlororaphis]MBM0284976.1 hypothetical protein [Pseudomonas chlororaphis]MDO1508550.1 hypothetical protein [Pseudomonas chlororaphis]ORM46108.1 hypothetical protein B6D51_21695 [Pseudomonas chlororaphis subsp. chlororaphis]TWR88015.1 hypothetical protein FJD36_30560 [Pseudomonas chlororaphis subsp. chlororaphis]